MCVHHAHTHTVERNSSRQWNCRERRTIQSTSTTVTKYTKQTHREKEKENEAKMYKFLYTI